MPEPFRTREVAPSPRASWVRVGFGLGIGLLLAEGLAQFERAAAAGSGMTRHPAGGTGAFGIV